MGAISDSILREPKKVPLPGVRRPVSAIQARQTCTATVLDRRTRGRDGESSWWYLDELAIEVEVLKFHEAVLLGGERLLWTGMAIKLKKTPETKRWSHCHLIASLAKPDTQNWFACAALKPPLKRKKQEILDRVLDSLNDERRRRATVLKADDQEFNQVVRVEGESALPAAIATLPFDPFETDPAWLTARLPDPMRFRWPDAEALSADYSIVRNPNYRAGSKKIRPLWCFGICANLEEARQELRTEALLSRQLQEIVGDLHSRALDEYDGAIDKAIWQTLAGRPMAYQPGMAIKPSPAINRLVRIVRYHLIDRSGVYQKKPRGHGVKRQRWDLG